MKKQSLGLVVLVIDEISCIHLTSIYGLFVLQLGYTKKQEERHFRGVITLEVSENLLRPLDMPF